MNPNTGEATTLVTGALEGGTNPAFFSSIGLLTLRKQRMIYAAQGDFRRFNVVLTGAEAPPEGFRPSSVVVADLNSDKESSTKVINIPGSQLANDLAFDPRKGRLFVTDVFGKSIFQIENIAPTRQMKEVNTTPMASLFANDTAIRGLGLAFGLSGPNGILYHPRNFLLVARIDASNSGIVKYQLGGRYSQDATVGTPVPLFDRDGNSLDGKFNETFNFDGIELGQENNKVDPRQLFVVVASAVLRFYSADNYKTLTLVQQFNLSSPCIAATTGIFGPDDKFFVTCTDFTNPANNAIVTIDVPPIHEVLGFTRYFSSPRRWKRRSYRSWFW